MKLTSAVILCLALFGQSVMAKPGYAAGYDVDYYVSVVLCFISNRKLVWNLNHLFVIFNLFILVNNTIEKFKSNKIIHYSNKIIVYM